MRRLFFYHKSGELCLEDSKEKLFITILTESRAFRTLSDHNHNASKISIPTRFSIIYFHLFSISHFFCHSSPHPKCHSRTLQHVRKQWIYLQSSKAQS